MVSMELMEMHGMSENLEGGFEALVEHMRPYVERSE